MIRFALHCANDHSFEGWFRDGATFDRQAADACVTCPECGDSRVRKAMMAPAVVRSATRQPSLPAPAVADPLPVPAEPSPQAKAATMLAILRKVREHVETNYENVGERFPEEARRIHYGEAEEREIFGQATVEEAKALHEEGIPVRPLPELPKLDS
jgi:hypothetical protein